MKYKRGYICKSQKTVEIFNIAKKIVQNKKRKMCKNIPFSLFFVFSFLLNLCAGDVFALVCGTDTVSYGGTSYTTVQIGTQCWFKKNLNVGNMLGSGSLPTDPAPTLDSPSTVQKWCYSALSANCTTYGGLYTWAEANRLAASCNTTSCSVPSPNQGICPTGWHIPTDAEFKTLEMYLGMTQAQADATGNRGTDQGSQLSAVTLNGTNSSGFTGLLGGNRSTDTTYNVKDITGTVWTATEVVAGGAYYRSISTNGTQVGRVNYTKSFGFSVRCVRDVVSLATITTQAVSSIATTTATGNGNITATGGDDPSVRGIQWGTTSGSYTSSCSAGAGSTGAYTCNLTALTPGRTYYVRAYATNSAGTSYGSEVSFTTLPTTPTVTTQAASAVTATTATGNGNVTATGGANPTDRRIQWGTTSGTYTSSCSAGAGATGAYTCGLTSLSPGTTYYVRANATNSAGTSYGSEVSFATSVTTSTVTTQAASAVTATTATGNGNVTATGGANPTDRGIQWGIASGTYISSCSAGAGSTGAYTCNMTYLTPNTIYYVRAYATNSVGTSYGSEVFFTTNTDITCGADTINYGSKNYTTVQIGTQCWFKENLNVGIMLTDAATLPVDPIPTTNDPNTVQKWCYNNDVNICNADGGLYTYAEVTAQSSTCNTTTCTRATNQGICPNGWHVPSDNEYKTLEMFLGMTQVQADTYGWRGIDQGSKISMYTLNGDNSSGFSAVFTGQRDWVTSNFLYRTNGTVFWTSNIDSPSNVIMRSLDSAYSTIGRGTGPGTFGFSLRCIQTTAPAATTNATSNITLTTATTNATITDVGGEYTTREIQYGTSSGAYTNTCTATTSDNIGNYPCDLTNLTPNTTYYLRAKTTNPVGTSYGAETSFTTLAPSLPTVTTQAPTQIVPTQATLNANLTNDGGVACTRQIEYGTASGNYTQTCDAGSFTSGQYVCNISALTPNTTYFYRAKVTNVIGTTYGSEMQFTTKDVVDVRASGSVQLKGMVKVK